MVDHTRCAEKLSEKSYELFLLRVCLIFQSGQSIVSLPYNTNIKTTCSQLCNVRALKLDYPQYNEFVSWLRRQTLSFVNFRNVLSSFIYHQPTKSCLLLREGTFSVRDMIQQSTAGLDVNHILNLNLRIRSICLLWQLHYWARSKYSAILHQQPHLMAHARWVMFILDKIYVLRAVQYVKLLIFLITKWKQCYHCHIRINIPLSDNT